MICPNCKSKIDDDSIYCAECGVKIDNITKVNVNGNLSSNTDSQDSKAQAIDEDFEEKTYVFDNYIGFNLGNLRLSRHVIVMKKNELMFGNAVKMVLSGNAYKIPYETIKEVKIKSKVGLYAIFCILTAFASAALLFVFSEYLLLSIICFLLGFPPFLTIKYKVVSIITNENKAFNFKVASRNKRVNEFIDSLNNKL